MAWLSHEAEVCARSGQSTLTSSRSRLQWRAEQSVLATRDDAPNNSTQLRRQAQLPRKIEIAEPSRRFYGKICTRLCCSDQPKGCISAAASLCSRVGKLSQEHLPLLHLLRAPNGRLRHPNLCAQAKRGAQSPLLPPRSMPEPNGHLLRKSAAISANVTMRTPECAIIWSMSRSSSISTCGLPAQKG